METWIIGILTTALIVFLVWRRRLSEERRALRHMHGRPPLTDDEFGRQLFPPERSEIAARLRRIMSHHIDLDLSRLHLDDLIVEDIRMDSLDSMSTVEFLIEVEKEFGIAVPNAEGAQMRTLREVTDYVYQAATRAKDYNSYEVSHVYFWH